MGWVFGTIVRGMQLANEKAPWPIVFLFAMFTPSQGFFNFLVYIRPRLIKHFAKKKKERERASSSPSHGRINSNAYHVSGFSDHETFFGGKSPDDSSSEFEVTKKQQPP